ncbi:MAG: TetR/AcrR family transcriptional regulator [Dehalococcoidia bacterium]
MASDKSVKVSKGKSLLEDITISDIVVTGRGEKGGARLLQIVMAAADLFHKKGYGPTTTRDIGEACNISPGHLYYYIKSKDDFPGMFLIIQKNISTKWENDVRKEMKRMPPDELLVKAVKDYTYAVHIGRKLTVFWYQAAVQVKREDSAGIMEVEKQVVKVFQEILEAGCQQGLFQVKDPFIVASNIVVMCQTWALKRWLYKDSRTVEQYVDQIVDLITAMVKGNAKSGSKKL